MSIIQSLGLLGSSGASGAAGFTIDQSLRFRGSQWLTRTFGTDNSGQDHTYSVWLKTTAENPNRDGILTSHNSSSQVSYLFLGTDQALNVFPNSATQDNSTALFRDPSAWFHLIVITDNSANTSTFYVNGQQVHQTTRLQYWNKNILHNIGARSFDNANTFEGYMASAQFIDGTAIGVTNGVPDEFGEYNDDGVWVPIEYTGSYGTNGFHLKFDSSGYNGSGGIGADHSGNGNDWTASGFDTGDVALWSSQVFTTGFSTQDFTSTRQNFNSTQPPTGSFDGSGSTAGQSAGGNDDSTYFVRFTTPIENVTSIEMKPTNGSGYQHHYINGTQGTFSSGGVKQTIYSGSAITLNTVGVNWISSNAGSGFYQLWVNGTELIDNTDNDVDYLDTPTSNYGTWNPLHTAEGNKGAFTDANLQTANNSGGDYIAPSTIACGDGHWYWEVRIDGVQSTGYPMIGILDYESAKPEWGGGTSNTEGCLYWTTGQFGAFVTQGSQSSYGATFTTGDIIGVEYNGSNGQLTFYKNGTSQGLATTVAASRRENMIPGVSAGNNGSAEVSVNFGQMPFIYSVPTGAEKLQTNNLSEPTIKQGSKHFGVLTYQAPGSPSYPITINGSGGNSGTGELDFNQSPDLVWIKMRNGSQSHIIFDTVRGASNSLRPDDSISEVTTRSNFAFATNGFSFSAADAETYQQNDSYVAWCWKASGTASVTYTVKVVSDSGNKYRFNDFGTSAVTLDLEEGGTYVFDQSDSSNSGHPLRFSTTSDGTHGGGSEYTTGVTTTGTPGSAGAKTTITVASGAATLHYYCSVHSGMGGQANTNDTKGSSNFDGTIQSKVTANTDAGFSIISYTGTGANATVGHALNSAPEFAIVKNRDAGWNWAVGSDAVDNWGTVLYLNNTQAKEPTNGSTYWNNLAPTASVLNIGSAANTNGSTNDMIAYCWHSVEGYSKFGPYTGNGSTDGPFVYLGFKPSLIICRCTSHAGSWRMFDSTRSPNNVVNKLLYADVSSIEATTNQMDFLSNGFKIRNADNQLNGSGRAFIYMAWAENPFGGENAPPATAR